MGEALAISADESADAEADAIDALQSRLASAETMRDESVVRKLRDELSAARMRRIKRVTSENWDALERLVGHRLRRG